MSTLPVAATDAPPAAETDSPHEPQSADAKSLLRRLHMNDRAYFLKHNLTSLAYLGLMAAAISTWMHGYWPLTVIVWAIAGNLGHAKLIAFHEASHGTQNRRRWVNELQGIGIGTVILVPLSVYRYVHGQHHAHLASEQDLEMWPFVNPGVSRFWRCAAAAGELLLGFFYTPILFLHGVLVGKNIPRRQQVRIVLEYALCGVVWALLVWMVARNGWWEQFAVGYLVPATIAASLQSLRKFTEHLGLTGDTLLTVTRTVVDERPLGRWLSDFMLNIDYHGTHHRYAKVPHYHLPDATPLVYDGQRPALPIFPNYWSAMKDMARYLGDPRVGPQWRR